jgi:hypothetical protein
MQIIEVPGVGEVEFPDDMDDAGISSAIQQMTGGGQSAAPPLGASHVGAKTQQQQAMSSHGATPTSAPEVGGPEATGRGAWQGASMGFGDEVAGALHATLGGVMGNDQGLSMGDRYRKARDTDRRQNALAQNQHGGLYTAGEIGGGMVPIASPISAVSKLRKVGLAGKAVLGGTTGAAAGAANAAGHNEDTSHIGRDMAVGAAVGTAGGVAGPVVGAAASRVAPALQKAGVATGYRHLRARGGDISARKQPRPEAIIEAYEAGAFRPGTTVHFAAERLAALRHKLGKNIGDLEDALAAAGVEGPERAALAKEFADEAARLKPRTSAADPRMTQMKAESDDLLSEIPKPPAPPPVAPNSVPPTQQMPTQPPAPVSSKLTLSEILAKKRSASDLAEADFNKLTGQRTPASLGRLKVSGKYKEVAEREINRQGPTLAPDVHAQWAPANKKFSHIAEAEGIAEEGSARAKGRNLIFNVPAMMGGVGGAASGGGVPAAIAGATALQVARSRAGSAATSALLGGSKLMSKVGAPALNSNFTKEALLSSLLRGDYDSDQ